MKSFKVPTYVVEFLPDLFPHTRSRSTGVTQRSMTNRMIREGIFTKQPTTHYTIYPHYLTCHNHLGKYQSHFTKVEIEAL